MAAASETLAAPNSTTLAAETSGIIPDSTTEKAGLETTAAPNNTTLTSEVSAVIPDSTTEKPVTEPVAAPVEPKVDTTSEPTKTLEDNAEKTEEAQKPVEAVATAPPAEPKATPIQELWSLTQSKGHPEIWGVTLADPATHVPTQIILQKYLNANDGDLVKAKDQLTKTIDWRAKTKPLELLQKKFNRSKFGGLGYVTTFGAFEAEDPELKEVFTWNIYGSVKNVEETFGNLAEFIEWRVVLMEEALQSLAIDKATKPITAEWDPYKIFQVHDYKSISFLRQQAVVKNASTETIKIFAQNYPELLKEKFFVNVPVVMGFIYGFIKLFVAAKTAKKFHPMSNAANLAKELTETKVKGLGEFLPKEYGGKGSALNSAGKQPALEDEPEVD